MGGAERRPTVLRITRVLPVLAAAAIAATACGEGDGPRGSDEPDPFVPLGCQIVWVTRDPPGQDEIFDYYVLDAPRSSWTSGPEAYFLGDPTGLGNVTGAWVDDYDVIAREWARAALATAGMFTLTLGSAGLEAGAPVSFEDPTPQAYFVVASGGTLAAFLGTSGTGGFDGVWSDPRTPDVQPGVGTVSIAVLGSAETLGEDLSWAQCYGESAAFASPSRAERIRLAGERAGARLRP